MAAKCAEVGRRLLEVQKRTSGARAELAETRALLKDAEIDEVLGRPSDVAALKTKIAKLENEVVGDPALVNTLRRAKAQLIGEIARGREGYAASIAPALNAEYGAAAERLGKALVATADLNVIVDRIQSEMERHGVPHNGLCYPGLSKGFRRAASVMGNAECEYTRWCDRVSAAGFKAPEMWADNEGGMAWGGICHAAQREQLSEGIAVNAFQRGVHAPLKAKFSEFVGRVADTLGMSGSGPTDVKRDAEQQLASEARAFYRHR